MIWQWLRRHIGLRVVMIGMIVLGGLGAMLGLAPTKSQWFFALLLGIGLLSSTFGIDLKEMRKEDWRLLLLAVTVGVTLKAAIIGIAMLALTREPRFLVIAITVAQMDPLSVGALIGQSKLSVRAENLLRAWAALDDPVTVALAILALTILKATHVDIGIELSSIQLGSLGSFGTYLVENVALMVTLIFFWEKAYHSGSNSSKLLFTLAFMASGVVIGATWFWMFGIALVGLFMRPSDDAVTEKVARVLEKATTVAFYASGLIVGGLMWLNGVDLWRGMALGALAFGSQIVVATVLVWRRGMSRRDHLYLACGHENGITACLLALSTHIVPIVMPAIVMTHLLHFACNKLLDRCFAANEE